MIAMLVLVIACSSNKTVTLNEAQIAAKKFNNKIDVLTLESTAAEIKTNIDLAIKKADASLAELVKIPKVQRNFDNTLGQLDQIFFEFDLVGNRHYFINSVSPNKDLREAATDSINKMNTWYNGVFFREDLYRAFNEYAQNQKDLSNLTTEQQRIFADTKKGFKKNGFELTKAKRAKLQKIKDEISEISTKFSNNIREFKNILTFTKEDLKGVPASALENLKQDKSGRYLMDARIVSDYMVIAQYAENENVRKRALLGRSSVAKKINAPLMRDLVKKRAEMAQILGYKNFADMATEDKMVGSGEKAISFITNLSKGLETKFQNENNLLRDLKRKHTNNPKAELTSWDGSFYDRLYLQEKFQINPEELKEYFSMQDVLKGMYGIFEKIFEIKIKKIENPNKWVDDLESYLITDKKTDEPLGVLYLDLYPREGKYSHFAQFGLISGKTLPNGVHQRPVGVLVCNFPKPTETKPSLLSYDHVETIFHEFGHALHNILSKTQYASAHGTSVPRDFVEAPSQMLEFWVRDKDVLDTFSSHYITHKKLPKTLLDNLFASKKVFIARFTRGQIAYAMTDLELHTKSKVNSNFDVIKETNNTIAKYFMPRPEGSSFITSFGHLAGGYAAGYYGYQWSLAIASDMAGVFEAAPHKFFDIPTGMKLRREIYQVGDSRDVNISIQKFLGRDWSLDAYLKELGI